MTNDRNCDLKIWSTVTEKTILLGDDLKNVVSYVSSPPSDANSPIFSEGDCRLDPTRKAELAKRLLAACGIENSSYSLYFTFRQRALLELWLSSLRVCVLERNSYKDSKSLNNNDSKQTLDSREVERGPSRVSFSSHISLLLLLPLLESQSRTEPALAANCTELLLHCLSECSPNSLRSEPKSCVEGLEKLLCGWLERDDLLHSSAECEEANAVAILPRERIVAALIALACGRLSIRSFVRVLHILQKHKQSLSRIPAREVIDKAIKYLRAGQFACPSLLQTSYHINSWKFELPSTDPQAVGCRRCYSLACDGKYLYVVGSSGKGLFKLGTGKQGTLRGHVYASNILLEEGWVVIVQDILLYRPQHSDLDNNSFGLLLNQDTLEVVEKIQMQDPTGLSSSLSAYKTLQLTSDGVHLYWVFTTPTLSEVDGSDDKTDFSINVLEFMLQKQEKPDEFGGEYAAVPMRKLLKIFPEQMIQETEAPECNGEKIFNLIRTSSDQTPVFISSDMLVFILPHYSTINILSQTKSATNPACCCFSLFDGSFISWQNVADSNKAEWQDFITTGLGVCCDSSNHVLWTYGTDQFVREWADGGFSCLNHVKDRLCVSHITPSDDYSSITPEDALSSTAIIISLLCSAMEGKLNVSSLANIPCKINTDKLLNSDFLRFICEVLHLAITKKQQTIMLSVLVTLQLLLKLAAIKEVLIDQQIAKDLRSFVWMLVCSSSESTKTQIQREACCVLISGLSVFYPDIKEQSALLIVLLLESEASSNALPMVRDLLLKDMTSRLAWDVVNNGISGKLADDAVSKILKVCIKDSMRIINNCATLTTPEFSKFKAIQPAVSPALDYLTVLVTKSWRELTLSERRTTGSTTAEITGSVTRRVEALMLAAKIFDGCQQLLDLITEVLQKIQTSFKTTLVLRLQALELVIKSTLLGQLLPFLVTVMSSDKLCRLPLAKGFLSRVTNVTITATKVAHLFSEIQAGCTSSTPPSEGHSLLSSHPIPSPWAWPRKVESMHPVRDEYKLTQTVQFPGASCLYLTFDKRCSTQYEYDKVTIHAGPNTNTAKVAEYGGNSCGAGFRGKLLRLGWPKEPLKVTGDVVTIHFQVKSTRETSSPEKALWGFACTVSTEEHPLYPDDREVSLSIITDVALGLALLTHKLLDIMNRGPQTTPEEESCSHLLNSELLQRCVWSTHVDSHIQDSEACGITITVTQDKDKRSASPGAGHSRAKLSRDTVLRLRSTSAIPEPVFRPSIQQALKPDELVEVILSAVIRHLNLAESVRRLELLQVKDEESSDYTRLCQIMSEVFRRLDGLIRQLQSMAELEVRWDQEAREVQQGTLHSSLAFFNEHHLQEAKAKELELLCYLKDVDFDPMEQEKVVGNLINRLENDAKTLTDNHDVKDLLANMPKTRSLRYSIMECAELLCNVTIHSAKKKSTPERSVSQGTFGLHRHISMEEHASVLFGRSLSAPSQLHRSISVQEGVHDVLRLQRWRAAVQRKRQVPLHEEHTEGNTEAFVTTIIEIFAFISSDPERAESCSSFLSAAHVRNERGISRVQALNHARELLSTCSRLRGHVPHLFTAVASVLVQGPRTEELKCGGMEDEVREAFSGVVQSLLQHASTQPTVYSDAILTLSVCPFSWLDERCIIRSGLVVLLDKLCVLRKENGSRKLSAMAWASFQVLLNRFVDWENEKDYCSDEIEWSGLAYQVSLLITNYLSCVVEESRHDNRDALQYVLQLLHNISRSKMGVAILQQPCIVSTLLSVLLDRRSPPKLVLTALRLCQVALPLMTAQSCDEVTFRSPIHIKSHQNNDASAPVLKVAKLLLAKLGEFVLPAAISEESYKQERIDDSEEMREESQGDEGKGSGVHLYSLCVHKRTDQPAHEVVQKVISREGQRFMFRVGLGSEVERAVRIDHELSQHNRAEVMKSKFATCLSKAASLTQAGLVTSIIPSALLHGVKRPDGTSSGSDPDAVCKARNIELARETSRPFISGQVANTLASEVICLLHGLVSSPASDTNTLWSHAVQQVLSDALQLVPSLIESLGKHIECGAGGVVDNEDQSEVSLDDESMSMSRQVIAALCALGGFNNSLLTGSQAKIVGEDMIPVACEIASVSERQGVATVLLDESAGSSFDERVRQVPLARLHAPMEEVITLDKTGVIDKAVNALNSILTSREVLHRGLKDQPEGVVSPIPSTLAARVLYELKARTSMVMAHQMKSKTFCDVFFNHQSHPVNTLKTLAEEGDPGQRLTIVEGHCEELRKLFKDLVKPLPKQVRQTRKKMVLDASRVYPPLQGVLFTEGYASAHMLGETNSGAALPRGAYIYATCPLPLKAPSYYWEVEILSLSGTADGEYGSSLSSISVGLAPTQEGPVERWSNVMGTCVLHDNGIAVHYKPGGFTSWQTINTGIALKKGHVVGCGYSRAGPLTNKGLVYFTHNGQRLPGCLEDVSAGLWPIVHLQKKDVRVLVNFGTRPFLYAKGSKIREAADLASDSMEELRENFAMLPFACSDDDEEDANSKQRKGDGESTAPTKSAPQPLDLSTVTEFREYDPSASPHYMLSSSCDVMTDVGPLSHMAEDEASKPSHESTSANTPAELLVKAWEERVFPVIRRRFRSEGDRRSGLEQIRGALLAGMMDIAIATVNDLYEDNGGIPNSLALPRLEDVKKNANKLTISSIKQGMSVAIANFQALPDFAIPAMKKTFGLVGVVQAVDKPPQSIVQVETYNHEEGTLMRFWYPISALEKAASGQGGSSALSSDSGDTTHAQTHQELLRCEATLTRLCCRKAYTEFLKRGPSPKDTGSEAALLESLSSQNLKPPQPDGSLVPSSHQATPSPRHALSSSTLLPSVLFFINPDQLTSEIDQLLSSCPHSDDIVKLTNSVCYSLKSPGHGVWHRELVVTPGAKETEVHFPKAAVAVVSCRAHPSYLTAGWVNSKKPLVTVLSYYGGSKLNKNGNIARYKAVQYPFIDRPMPQTGDPGTYWSHLYPCRILPCNKLCLRTEEGAVEGPIVDVHAISSDSLLGLVFIEVFIAHFLMSYVPSSGDAEDAKKAGENSKRAAMFNIIDLLTCFLLKTSLPGIIKEVVFHLLAQLLRVGHQAETLTGTVHSRGYTAPLTLILTRLAPLRTELQKLLDKEVSVTNASALEFILKCNFENDKFSSYLQALFELALAMAEVAPPNREGSGLKRERAGSLPEGLLQSDVSGFGEPLASPDTPSSPSSQPTHFDFKSDEGGVTSSTDAPAPAPTSVTWHQRRRRSLRKRKRAHAPDIVSPTETMPWFETVLSNTLMLRHLLHRDDIRGVAALKESLSSVVSIKSNVLQRLLVITNIPKTMKPKAVVHALKKACKPSGGIVVENVYLPEIAATKVPYGTQKSDDGSNEVGLRSLTQMLPSAQSHRPDVIQGHAVVELLSGNQLELACQAISSSKALRTSSSGQEQDVGVCKVTSELLMEGTNELVAYAVFDQFLTFRLIENGKLRVPAQKALLEIFNSCIRCAGSTGMRSGQDTPVLSREASADQSRFQVQQVDSSLVLKSDGGSSEERTPTPSNEKMTETSGLGESGVQIEMQSVLPLANAESTSDLDVRTTMTRKLATTYEAPLSLSETDIYQKGGAVTVKSSASEPVVCEKSASSELAREDRGFLYVTEGHVCSAVPGNLLVTFLNTFRLAKQSVQELVGEIVEMHGIVANGSDGKLERGLHFQGLLEWMESRSSDGLRALFKSFIACGYGISFERCTYMFPGDAIEDDKRWTTVKDTALLNLINSLSVAISSSPSRLMPDEIHITEADRTTESFHVLREHSIRSIRSRFAFLKSTNQTIEQLLLPLTDQRASSLHSFSTAALLHKANGLLFYDTKMAFLKRTLDHSNHRGTSYISPEISLDPLETLEADKVSSSGPQFNQAAQYLASVTSAGLRVKVATGGDPVFPLRVHLRGEQVLGSGGSFRHFMWLMARELQSPHVSLLIPCPSSAANRNKGKYILKPGPMSYSEEKLLIFFGQLLGIALRSDIPLAVDLMPVFWKSLLGLPLDAREDLFTTDILTYNYLRRFSEVETREEFNTLCMEADLCPYRFVYTSLCGDEVDLCPNGAETHVTWENHRDYVEKIRNFRLRELRCESRMAAVLCGLYSVVPLQVLSLMTPADMEIRTCGKPSLDLDFLKAHTTYVAGIRESDPHIEFFWTAMENFSQDQLRKFIKFACNQERLPSRCTCQEGNSSRDVHVPPYPMKIGPPDGRGRSDARYIRVETCMFMVKLPQYSTQQIMTDKLLYAINCREDPLTDL